MKKKIKDLTLQEYANLCKSMTQNGKCRNSKCPFNNLCDLPTDHWSGSKEIEQEVEVTVK